jgi:hypothetical protein
MADGDNLVIGTVKGASKMLGRQLLLRRFCSITPMACLALCGCVAPLRPIKPSDLVTLIADPLTPICPATTVPHLFSDRLLPDGTRVPFTIPTNMVLIITSFDWVVEGSSQAKNTVWTAVTFMGTGKNNALFSGAMADSIGRAAGNTTIPNGVTVGPGTVMCLDYVGGVTSAYGRVHGFLAPKR